MGSARSAKLREYSEKLNKKCKKLPAGAGEPVVQAKRVHPFPSRTRKLSSSAPMILRGQLRGKIGQCRLTRLHR